MVFTPPFQTFTSQAAQVRLLQRVERTLTKLIYSIGLLIVVGTMVWLTTLYRWQTAGMEPSLVEVIVYLAVLPIGLTAVLLVMQWQGRKLREFIESPAEPPASKPAVSADSPPPPAVPRCRSP